MGKSAIEWTDATWNPVTGCTKVSPGCLNCYAEVLTGRFAGLPGWPRDFVPWTVKAQRDAQAMLVGYGGPVQLHHERLDQPLRWRKPQRIFVCSMSDLFHEAVPTSFIAAVFQIMASARHHTFQVLTKRPQRALELLGNEPWYVPNVWLGVSVENQRYADERLPLLAQIPAAKRFVSCEPLLGPLDLREWLEKRPKYNRPDCPTCGGSGSVPPWMGDGVHRDGVAGCPDCEYDSVRPLDWVIVGGESGPGFRPMRLEWVQALRDQATDAYVPFFFKQVGGATNKSGGRQLDGREWDGVPGDEKLYAAGVLP